MKAINPCLWFDNQAEEAVKYYVSIFPNSKIGAVSRYDKASAEVSGQKEGSILTVSFSLNGQDYIGMNGGPLFKFSEAISFVVNCEDQKEIDYYWEKLSAVPASEQCGWLKDKFGMSWQIVPTVLEKLMSGDKAREVMAALLKMKKLDIEGLEKAVHN
jgi:predicted 3-demethylubiquinone-9 3-methyltransferase (glyoxalase superfamily)